MTQPIAFGLGALIAIGFLFGGHYAFQPPRPPLRPPWAYVYGVVSVMLGVGAMALILGTWQIHYAWWCAFFVIGGLFVIWLYHLDGHLANQHKLADYQEQLDLARRSRRRLGPDEDEL